jgi:hypothetical protein
VLALRVGTPRSAPRKTPPQVLSKMILKVGFIPNTDRNKMAIERFRGENNIHDSIGTKE